MMRTGPISNGRLRGGILVAALGAIILAAAPYSPELTSVLESLGLPYQPVVKVS